MVWAQWTILVMALVSFGITAGEVSSESVTKLEAAKSVFALIVSMVLIFFAGGFDKIF